MLLGLSEGRPLSQSFMRTKSIVEIDRGTSIANVVSMGPEIIRLVTRLQAISFNRSVRILHSLLLHIFRVRTLLVHALVPLLFPLRSVRRSKNLPPNSSRLRPRYQAVFRGAPHLSRWHLIRHEVSK